MGKNKPRSDKRLDSHEPWRTVTAKEGRASTGEGRGTLELLADVQAADLEMITHPEKGRGCTDAFTAGLRSSQVAAKAK